LPVTGLGLDSPAQASAQVAPGEHCTEQAAEQRTVQVAPSAQAATLEVPSDSVQWAPASQRATLWGPVLRSQLLSGSHSTEQDWPQLPEQT